MTLGFVDVKLEAHSTRRESADDQDVRLRRTRGVPSNNAREQHDQEAL